MQHWSIDTGRELFVAKIKCKNVQLNEKLKIE